jgi:O-antigen ligase
MPSSLALLACTVFVAFLLWVEGRASRRVSAAFWIPTVWMLSIGSKPFAIWFGASGPDIESGSRFDEMILMGLCVSGIVMLIRRRFGWAAVLRQHGWLLALLLYMLASTLWSEIGMIAFRRWVREIIVVIMAMVVMSEAYPRQALESLMRRTTYILIPLSLVLIRYYGTLGRVYGRWSGHLEWTGVTFSKNMLGGLCLISILFLFWALYRGWGRSVPAGGRWLRWADMSVLLIAVYLLRGGGTMYSATSLACLGVGIVTFLALHRLRRLRQRTPLWALLVTLILVIGLGVATPFGGASYLSSLTPALGREETFTGRTWIWEAVIPEFKRMPWLGHGFQSFWTTERRAMVFGMPYAHNGYLDILLELGVVGLALYTAWVLSSVAKLRRMLAQDLDWASLALSFWIVVALYNYTESMLNSLAWQTTAVMTIITLVVPYKGRRARRQGPAFNPDSEAMVA